MSDFEKFDEAIDEEGLLPEFVDGQTDGGTESEAYQPGETVEFIVDAEASGMRLDAWLAGLLPRYSRVAIRQAISSGCAVIDDKPGLAKPAFRIKPGQKIAFTLPDLPRSAPVPEEIPLDILYEDESLAVINKPAGMVVHPSRGHWAGTLVGALAFHFQNNLSQVRGSARPGIVHRLDRDTSGVIIVAKTDYAHMKLAEQFEQREIHKEYVAICSGAPPRDRDVIDAPIGPHPHQSEKMAIRFECEDAKPAKTFYEVLRRYKGFTYIKAMPKTGRTHQIRLHFIHAGFPILCDRLYGGRAEISEVELGNRSFRSEKLGVRSEGLTQSGAQNPLATPVLTRQALHARRIQFRHPETGQSMDVSAPLPDDFKATLELLEKYRRIDN